MQWPNLLAILLTACMLTPSESYKILCIFPHVAKSHYLMAEALMKGLAAKGHQVTMISHFPQEKPIPNYRDISLVGSMPEFVSNVPVDTMATGYVKTSLDFLAYMGYVTCENTLEFPAMKKFIAANEKFDLVVTELFNTDCMLGYAYKLNVPFIALTTSVKMPWAYGRFGLPDNPSYLGNHMLGHATHMTFKERLINMLYEEGMKIWYHYVIDKPAYELAKKYFGNDLPPLYEIAKNTSLLLTNTHFSLNRPRPLVPNVVEVGGIHLKPPSNKLPADVKKFLDEAKDGVIYFSLGSSVRADTFSEQKRDAFVQAFKELPQRVLWKWESKTLPGKSDNVMIASWLPQMDVLGHPNIKVFVTHGGLLGTMESAYSGVPMVGIPLFGDQFHNLRCYEEEGIAVILNYHTLSKQTILAALRTVLGNPRYAENSKKVKEAYNDRPLSPLDTAIYWTEYVIRHKGARHMRSAAVDMPLYQYLLLDVIVVLLVAVLVVIAVPYFILKKLFSLCCRRNNSKQKVKKS